MKCMVMIILMLGLLIGCGSFEGSIHDDIAYDCTVKKINGVATIECPDGTVVEISDGVDGANGVDGLNGEDGTTIDIVDPCGDGPGHDEVVFLLDNGTAIAWYYMLGLVVLEENKNYVTTDQQRCQFRIEDGEVI